MNFYIYRNFTVENLFVGYDASYSGYSDIALVPEDVTNYVWFYLPSINLNGFELANEVELKDAMAQLGINDFRFLGAPNKKWRDSGMMGTPQNERGNVFWQADLDEASHELVKIILEIQPQVLITYDEFGGYGHPDHIKAHRVAMRAAELAAEQGWQVSKIYWNTIPRSVIQMGIEKMKEVGSDFFGAQSIDDLPFAKPDELATTVVNAPEYVPQKLAAMKAHATQISEGGPFFALSNNLGLSVWGDEYYTLVKGEKAAPFDSNGRELDIFAGVI